MRTADGVERRSCRIYEGRGADAGGRHSRWAGVEGVVSTVCSLSLGLLLRSPRKRAAAITAAAATLVAEKARPAFDEHVGRRLREGELPREGRAGASSRAYDAIRSMGRAGGRVIVRRVCTQTCLSVPVHEKPPPCVECPANSRRAFRRCLQASTSPQIILAPLMTLSACLNTPPPAPYASLSPHGCH